MAERGGTCRRTLEREGTYEYFSSGYEYLGMVGKPGGLGENPSGYGEPQERMVIYRDGVRLFQYLNSDRIVQEKVVPYPMAVRPRKRVFDDHQ